MSNEQKVVSVIIVGLLVLAIFLNILFFGRLDSLRQVEVTIKDKDDTGFVDPNYGSIVLRDEKLQIIDEKRNDTIFTINGPRELGFKLVKK
jgi:hypothetical protein